MQKTIKYLGYLDYVVALGTIIYGLLVGPSWLAAAGGLGLVLAWYSPAAKIQRLLATHFLGRKKRAHAADDAAAALEAIRLAEEAAEIEAPGIPAKARDFRSNGFTSYGPMRLAANRHNLLRPSSGNLVTQRVDLG